MNIFDPLSIPLGKLMNLIYYSVAFESYGIALIIFTVLTRLAMLPLTIKQYQGTSKMQKLAPKLEEIRKQFGQDKKRMQEETMKLYQQEKVNPAGGCLPLLIQMPILFSLYPVITRPLRYMLGKTQEQIAALQELYTSITGSAGAGSMFVQEMEMLNFFKTDASALTRAQSANLLVPSDLINMRFLGLDLSRTPTYSPDILFGEQSAIYLPLLLIPIIGVAATYISGRFAMASSAAQSASNPQASSMGKTMQMLGPVMTLIFSFQLPAGVLVYWIAGYLIQIVQQLFINKYILKLDNIFTGKKNEEEVVRRRRRGRIAGQVAGAPGLPQGKVLTLDGESAGQGARDSAAAANGGSGIAGTNAGYASPGGPAGSGAAGGAGGNLDDYNGEGFIEKMTSLTGLTGGGRVKSAGPRGAVHGGVFKPAARIPGVTEAYDDEITGDDDAADDDAENGSDGIAENGADRDGITDGEGGANTARTQNATSNPVRAQDATSNPARTPGPASGTAGAQRQRPAGSQSNTKKNYGSQKRKKKK